MFAGNSQSIVFIICWIKTSRLICYGSAFLKYDTGYFSILCKDFLWSPATIDLYVFFFRFPDLFLGSGHGLSAFQTEHGNFGRTTAMTGSGHVNGHVTTANYNGSAGYLIGFISPYGTKEFNSCHNAFGILTGNPRRTATLTSDGYVKCFVSLCSQLIQSNIFSYFYACSEFYTHLTKDINFCCNNILLQNE